MILNIKYNISGDNETIKSQIFNKLYNTLTILESNPIYYLKSTSISVSFPSTGGKERHYIFILKTHVVEDEDIRGIVYYIEEKCRVKGIKIEDLDKLFVKLSVGKRRI